VHSAIILLGVLAIPLLTAEMVSAHASSSTGTANTLADLSQTEAAEQAMDVYQNPIVNILANELETRINKSGAILEITSKLPDVNSAPFASSISPELHGIPKDADMPKRKVAQDILDTDKDFEVIYFLMPNGDMYLVEPYSRQDNLTRNNFAFRDYYRGALDTGDTYLSDILISASTGRPQANIAVPIYSENNNGTLVGLLGGGLNITMLSNWLQSLNLTNNNERVVYVDKQGQKIADSDSQSSSSSLLIPNNTTSSNEPFADLQAFKNAINGQSGSTTEMINDTMMLVSYHPVKAFSNTWVVLFMEPYPLSEIGSSSSSRCSYATMLSSSPPPSPVIIN
jgi:Cache domain